MCNRNRAIRFSFDDMRKSFKKLKHRVTNYGSYFRKNLLEKLCQQTFVNKDYGFEKFCNITIKTLD